jgi:hypothetical protein
LFIIASFALFLQPMKLHMLPDYIRHRLTAKNRHGLHSPYIYHLLDTVIHAPDNHKDYATPEGLTGNLAPDNNMPNPQKVNRLLYRLLRFFEPASLAVADNVNNATGLYLQHAVPGTRFVKWHQLVNETAACMVCDAADINIPALKPGGVLIVTNIYYNEQTKTLWRDLKAREDINVTADLFYIGLAFNRPKQAEEHFKLRF